MSRLHIICMSFLFLSSSHALAKCKSTKWEADGVSFEVCYDTKEEATLSSSCFENRKCGARQFLKKVEDLVLKATPEVSTQNPGTIYCKWLNGIPILGRNQRQSQNAFCQAKDKTVVSLADLAGRKSK